MPARQVYFHTKTEQEANRCINDVSIIANCGGIEFYYSPFKNKTTRKDYGIVYVINGTMDFYIKDKVITLSEGGFTLGKPHDYVTYFASKDNFLNYYWLNFTGNRVENIVKQSGLEFRKAYNIGVSDQIADCFKNIFNEFLINDSLFALNCEAGIINLLSAVARKSKNSPKPCLKSIEYIHKYYNKDISVEELANMENLSYPYYYSVFKDITKMSPQEYIITQKVNNACFHLLNTNLSVSQIAELSGYTDQCYFSRIFKKRIGLSPLEYRKTKSVK